MKTIITRRTQVVNTIFGNFPVPSNFDTPSGGTRYAPPPSHRTNKESALTVYESTQSREGAIPTESSA